MRGKPTSEFAESRLRDTWLANQSESRAEIHRQFELKHGKGIIGLRKAQGLIPTFSESA